MTERTVAEDGRTDSAPASDQMSIASTLQAELFRRSLMLATAESLTGGRLGDVLSAAPGASDTYLGGVISYATGVKQKVLHVSEETVERHGVVSAECAEEMAAGVRELTDADFAVSTTGVAGPTTQEGKPIGLVFVGVAGPEGVRSERFEFDGDRAEIREKVVKAAIDLVLEAVTGTHLGPDQPGRRE
ncbi:MAG TPA: CinA family protein [Nocardioidaceae bacterium]|nr:CinA family protein [Nocardioidaceae bacterium]